MRVLAFARDDPDMDTDLSAPARIRALARVDVVSHPALGNGVGRLMSAQHDQDARGPQARPFSGQRLENAIWNPAPPDVLVAACPDACDAVPDDIQRGLPWIHVLVAWSRLQPMVPSDMLQICWDRGRGDFVSSNQKRGRLESEAWFIALALHQLLHYAPPQELIALSREAA